MPAVSIVIPLRNEAPSLPRLYDELRAVALAEAWTWEAIFVDDGSSDQSWPTIVQLAASAPEVRGLKLKRNYGKSAALTAGFRAAQYPFVVMSDADLQDVPAEIPKLLAAIAGGLDLVTGWKQARQDTFGKRLASRGFNRLVNLTSGLRLHDHYCGLKAMLLEFIDRIPLRGGMHRFLTVFARQLGYRVGEIAVHHRRREFGQSKYGWRRLPEGLVDLVRVTLFGKQLIATAANDRQLYEIETTVNAVRPV
ncbi:MAG: glycosyltransferase family 2 protein [Planctomycetota bacterium]